MSVLVDIYPTTDKTLPTFDYTTLSSINTCPTFGLLRYHKNKVMSGVGRSMALEAGGAAHEVFSAHRLYSFKEYGEKFFGHPREEIDRLFRSTGYRLFGNDRFGEMLGAVNPSEDFRTRCQQFCLTSLYNSGFYDDPTDKRRTVTNIEELALAYMDRFDWQNELPIIYGENLGIEIPIDVTLAFDFGHGRIMKYRFIGRVDGVHYTNTKRDGVRIHENKTASRLNDAWELSFETSHQVTGYMVAISALLKWQIHQAIVIGTALPMPKTYSMGGLTRLVVNRYDYQIEEWARWFLHTVKIYEEYKDDIANAPQYTHSCNRYFRPCMFIPFCTASPEDRIESIEEMPTDEWSPLHDKYGTVQDE